VENETPVKLNALLTSGLSLVIKTYVDHVISLLQKLQYGKFLKMQRLVYSELSV